MTTETLTALQDSIRHWHRLSTGTQGKDERPSPQDCALCKLFYIPGNCAGCPVSQAAKASGCRNTPYKDAFLAYRDQGLGSQTFRRAAAKELAFLLDLLPAEARPAMDAELAALSGTCHVCGLRALHADLYAETGGEFCPACEPRA